MKAPTPIAFKNEVKFDFELKKEVTSQKNKKYLLIFKAENNLEISIKAINNDDIIQKIYTNKFHVEKIRENKYFYQFDDLKEICEEFSQRISTEKISLIEDTNLIIISIPLPSSKIKEIIFELKENEKSDKEIINDLVKLVHEQNNEISNLKNRLNSLEREMSFIFKNYICNLDSLIVDNNCYNSSLKSWINPASRIKVNLLYRLSRDGPEISTFHKLCDNKGPTLTLFHLKEGNKIGFFVNDSFDSTSEWKKDNNCFIFNLNQNKKFQSKGEYSGYFNSINCGPSANGLGCNPDVKLKYIYIHPQISNNYEEGYTFFPYQSKEETEYEVIETEIFQVIAY